MSKTHIQDNVIEKTALKIPSFYKVILINDDYTPMDFVVTILTEVFEKDQAQAELIMLKVHHEGQAVCGVYTFEIAETKANIVKALAQSEEHPLQCTVEKEDLP